MKIAVTYEDGNVFQHFGRTESFKIYEVINGVVESTQMLDTNGTGHEALAYLLADNGVDALICGGMGQGAKDALEDAGIDVCGGASGNADEAIAAFLCGELTDSGVNCDHHHEHGEAHDHHHSHEHSHDFEGGCDGCGTDASGCAGCGVGMSGCAGCGGFEEPELLFEGKNAGKRVKVHYIGTFDDGTQFESSYDRNAPLEFVCATGAMLLGFDKAVADLEIGETTEIHLEPEDAYGMPNPAMILTVDRATTEGAADLEVGDAVVLEDELGRPFRAVISAADETTVSIDCNHEMAGKALNFKIELVEVC